ncbi:MAG: tRNA (guanosine(37)-N1)-methyltransferase TrmD [Vampirovibrionales bacterium]
MQFSLITLFPEAVTPYLQASIIGKGIRQGLITVNWVNPRDFANNKHNRVDDTPYGGGPGMVLMAPPVVEAVESLKPFHEPSLTLITSPGGRVLTDTWARELATYQQLILVCGHYEGLDARVTDCLPGAQDISIGDFVLTGGELAALCVIDAVSRFIPHVVQKSASVINDSHSPQTDYPKGLLEHPHYTRPENYRGHAVPDVLLSGNHAAIAAWRHQQALEKTRRQRPDLLI